MPLLVQTLEDDDPESNENLKNELDKTQVELIKTKEKNVQLEKKVPRLCGVLSSICYCEIIIGIIGNTER